MKLRDAWEQLRLIKHYIIAAALVFVVAIFLGASEPERYSWMINLQLEALEKLKQEVVNKPNVEWSLFWVIFLNNTKVSLQVILSGLFFGIPPLFLLVSNGILLGYAGAVGADKESLFAVLKGILPHGILELPAIVLACALSLRLGVLVSKWLISLPSPARSKIVVQHLKVFLRALIPLCALLVVTLFVAAVIESTITYWMVQN
ncbi:stage II sporulation protein M [Paenibacillus sp. UNCCL117]|uniref:stage II sporulation protein M n=1 Tax=unclassified Paenibacillus TaxID=185978 RepID=UPI00088C250C|nr:MULTISPECIES: stage II sporulation protein M [unclassified Paenibacillus]SDE57372.1 stage II sporulation protein M [Paenibacillus sp. cl123]SFW68384.1 stage II sporulation protein M [Paenibacillus sp. UNCCL117]